MEVPLVASTYEIPRGATSEDVSNPELGTFSKGLFIDVQNQFLEGE